MKKNLMICQDCQEKFIEDLKSNCSICGGILIISPVDTVFNQEWIDENVSNIWNCLLYTSPSPRD